MSKLSILTSLDAIDPLRYAPAPDEPEVTGYEMAGPLREMEPNYDDILGGRWGDGTTLQEGVEAIKQVRTQDAATKFGDLVRTVSMREQVIELIKAHPPWGVCPQTREARAPIHPPNGSAD